MKVVLMGFALLTVVSCGTVKNCHHEPTKELRIKCHVKEYQDKDRLKRTNEFMERGRK